MKELFDYYFSELETTYGSFASICKAEGLSAFQMVNKVYQSPVLKKEQEEKLPKVQKLVSGFWEINRDLIAKNIQKLPGIKAYFGGDMSPHFGDGSISGAGVYYDTILIEDPIQKSMELPLGFKPREQFILKYALELLLQKDFFLAETFPPIALLFDPKPFPVSPKLRSSHFQIGVSGAIAFFNQALGTKFEKMWEFREFFRLFLPKPKDFLSQIKNPEAFFFVENCPMSLIPQIEGHIQQARDHFNFKETPFGEVTDTETVLVQVISYFVSFLDLSYKARVLGAELLIPGPPAFHWFIEMLKILEQSIEKELGKSFSINLPATNNLFKEHYYWLSNLTSGDLVRLRNLDGLNDLRSEIGKGLADLSACSFSEFSNKCEHVDMRFHRAFSLHQEKLTELGQRTKDEIVVSATEFIAPLVAYLKPSVLGSLSDVGPLIAGVAGSIKLKDIAQIVIKHLREKEQIGKSPIGMLWKCKNDA